MFEINKKERHSTIFLRVPAERKKISGMKGFKSIENMQTN
jgi:hypothetical protein